MTLTQITEKGIKDGEIINADINASASIAQSKLNTFVNTNGVHRIITGSATKNTINGNSNLTYNGVTLKNQLAAENGTIAQFELSGNTNDPALLIKADESDSKITFRAGATTNVYPKIAFDMGTVGDALTILNDGKVGIGTTNPRTELDLSDGQLSFSHRTDYSIRFYNGQGNNWSSINNPRTADGTNASELEFRTAQGVAMHMATDMKIGIGTTSPDTLLHLRGADTAIIRLENSDDSLTADQIIGGLEFEKTDPNGAGAGVVGGVRMYSQGVVGENTYLAFATSSSSTNNVEHMRLEDDGDLRLSSDNASTNFGFVDGWNDAKGNFIIGADQSTTGNASSTDGSAIILRTRGGERARIQHAGGISFNGDTAQANALNDYEEGTFTAGIQDFNGTYTANTGTYTKIGNVVTIQVMIQGNGGSGSGALKLTSLPFNSENSPTSYRAAGSVHAHQGVVTGGVQVTALMNNNDNKINIRTFQNNANTVDLNRSGLNSSGWELVIGMVYHTAS